MMVQVFEGYDSVDVQSKADVEEEANDSLVDLAVMAFVFRLREEKVYIGGTNVEDRIREHLKPLLPDGHCFDVDRIHKVISAVFAGLRAGDEAVKDARGRKD